VMGTTVFLPDYVQFKIKHTVTNTWYNYLVIIDYVILFITSRVSLCETERDKLYYTRRHPFKAPTPPSKLFNALFHILILFSYNQRLCLIMYFRYAIYIKAQGLHEYVEIKSRVMETNFNDVYVIMFYNIICPTQIIFWEVNYLSQSCHGHVLLDHCLIWQISFVTFSTLLTFLWGRIHAFYT
jgi:hypothetical protein